ncbi:Putative major facilitator superfamily, MFS transporter superfamily [Septoria linicola]|uniref:Major facilitator superfamily, MFS transporter superfamily n=1 Tax=Septoria linicola TaxID=215465 RepID=A0A9Q9B5I3_9PEZI|nr:Putative major facilitator superfamily, MFS transporter superfamily [Septoria linicola]
MRLQKTFALTSNGRREARAYGPQPKRYSQESVADEEGDGRYEPARNSCDYPEVARLCKPRPQSSHNEFDLPAVLRPAGAYTGRLRLLEAPDTGLGIPEDPRIIRTRRDQIDSWINRLDSQISVARTKDTSSFEEVLLTRDMPHDMPPLARAEQIRPRTWSGNTQTSPPPQSVHGSILTTSSAGCGPRSQIAVAQDISVRLIAEESGAVAVDEPWTKDEILVVALSCAVQALLASPYGHGLATAVSLSASLTGHDGGPEVPRAKIVADASWITAAYPLTWGSFALLGEKVGSWYGHKLVMLIALVWWTAFQLSCGFSNSVAVMCSLRGLTGIGAAFAQSNIDALLEASIPHGRKTIIATSVSGAMSLFGTAIGCLFAALLVHLTHWKWSFIAAAALVGLLGAPAWLVFPVDEHKVGRRHKDWIGAYLGTGGLLLFGFVWISAPVVGWSTPYIYCLLLVSLGHFVSFGLWEAKLAKEPLVPAGMWDSRHFLRGIVVLLCSSMSLGIFLWYFSLFGTKVRHYNTVENGANFQPITALVGIGAMATVWLLPRISIKYLISMSNFALVLCNILLATAPKQLTYWASMFPAMLLVAVSQSTGQSLWLHSIDLTNRAVANSLVSTTFTYGLSIGIGVAGTVERHSNDAGHDLLAGYRCAFVLAMALAGTALVGSLMFLTSDRRKKAGGFESI